MNLSVGPILQNIARGFRDPELPALARQLNIATPETDRSALYSALSDPQRINSAMSALSPAARALLTQVLLHGGLLAWDRVANHDDLSEVFHELGRQALLFNVQNQYGGHYLALPREYVATAWRHLISPEVAASMAAKARAPRREVVAYDWMPFLQQAYQVLSFMRTEPLTLTQHGYVYKRLETRLGQLVWPNHEADAAANELLSMLRYLTATRLIRHDPVARSLVVQESVAREFFNAQAEDRCQSWLAYASEQHGSELRQIIIAVASQIESDQFLDLTRLTAWLAQYDVKLSDPARDVHLQGLRDRQVWEPGDVRGIGRLTDPAYFGARGQIAPSVPGQAVIQPTGEVLVPPETPWSERWQWDRMATLVRTDRMAVYQLDRRGVERALDLQTPVDALIATIEGLARSSIPTNVRANLDDWNRALTRHRFIQGLIVHSDSPQHSKEVEKRLGRRILSRLSDTVLIIAPDAANESIRMLNKAGIIVRSRIERPGFEAAPAESDDSSWDPYRHDWTLADPIIVVRAVLPSSDLKIPNYPQMRAVVEAAIKRRAVIRVTHQPAGGTEPVTQDITPYQLQNGWLHGAAIKPNLGMVGIVWQQILSVHADETS